MRCVERSWRARLGGIAAGIAVMTLTAGCGGDSDDDAANDDAITTAAAATNETGSTATVAPTTTEAVAASTTADVVSITPPRLPPIPRVIGDLSELPTVAVGTPANYEDGSTVTVHSVEQPFVDSGSIIQPRAGTEYVSVEVEVCVGSPDTATILTSPFEAHTISGARLASTLLGARMPPFSGLGLRAGNCSRGYLSFTATAGDTVEWIVWNAPGWDAIKFSV